MYRRPFLVTLHVALLFGGSTAAGQDNTVDRVRQILLGGEQRPDYHREISLPTIHAIELPLPPAGETPAVVRGVYLNAWVFGGQRFYNLLRLADTTELNAFVVDVKDDTGHLLYRSAVPTAIEIGANNMVRASDVRERLALLKQHGIHPIARIVVAKDPLLAREKTEWAVRHVDGGLWRDRLDFAWVDAFKDSVWIYAAQIAEEAVMMGFEEIQFDYVRFPDEPRSVLAKALFSGRRPGESKRDGVVRNLQLIRDRLKPLGVPFTLDIFGLTTSARGDLGIGQVWEDLVSVADVVLPMVYPSHYYTGAYGYRRPNYHPYEIVKRAMEDGLEKSAPVENPARVRPFLQSFSIRKPRYGAPEIRAQIDAVYDAGLTDWVLWNASGRYPAGAFLPADSPPAAPVADGTSGR